MISSITSKLTESPVKRLKAIETVNQHDRRRSVFVMQMGYKKEEKRTKTGCWRALFLPRSDHRTGKQFAYGVRYVIIEEIF